MRIVPGSASTLATWPDQGIQHRGVLVQIGGKDQEFGMFELEARRSFGDSAFAEQENLPAGFESGIQYGPFLQADRYGGWQVMGDGSRAMAWRGFTRRLRRPRRQRRRPWRVWAGGAWGLGAEDGAPQVVASHLDAGELVEFLQERFESSLYGRSLPL